MSDLEVSVPQGSLTLAGSFRSAGDTDAPAALIVSGSGPLDRDSNAKRMPLGVAAQLADHLAAHGIASLRYDKRGVGSSDGEYLRAGFHDNVDDARAALAVLRRRPEVNADHIVVIGHSEGALIAGELAHDPAVAGAVLLAGTAHTGRQVLEWQAAKLAPTLPAVARFVMRVLRQDLVRTQTKRLDRLASSTDDVVRLQGVKVNARWFREFMAFDPVESLGRIAGPVLAITGAADVQVDPADVARMGDAVTTPFDGHVLTELNHILRHDPDDVGLRGYKKLMRQPVDARLLDLVTTWIDATVATRQDT